MFECMLAYSLRRDKPICTRLGMLIPCDWEENIEESKLRENILGSSPGEGGSCSSEIKHDRRTAPRQSLFVSARRSQELRSQTRKLFWVRVPVKMLGLGIIFSYNIQRK
jgi:hypothetical protein